jgi:RNA polymerase sigma factor (sigma-70 family)
MKLAQEEIIELIQECAKGDANSLKKFFEIYSQDIYNFPIRVFHLDEDDASEFFIYAYERLKSGKRFQTFVAKSGFKTWLFTVLRNLLIDWKRNQKEIKIISSVKVNSDGEEYSTIESEPDLKSEELNLAQNVSHIFNQVIADLKLENRVLFKLAYIYYLNLDPEEIKYICKKTGMHPGDLGEEIIKVRHELSDKEIHNMELEDKISAIYMSILRLKDQLKKNKHYEFNDNLPSINKIQISIDKKYEQRRKLLEKKHKGNFITRTPYKTISQLLQIPENGISISLQRIIEKIQKKFLENDI